MLGLCVVPLFDSTILLVLLRLEEMGAPPPTAAKSSARRKQQQQFSEGETPGEVLGNFFLNYKKDRQDILNRCT